jgi:predicted porin/outer membrane murein-binding lipoprotein Lpp
MRVKRMALICAVAFGAGSVTLPGTVSAQSPDEMKRQIDALQRQLEALKNRMDEMSAQQQKAQAAPQAAPQPAPQAAPASAGGGHNFLERKEGDGVTFLTRGGEVTIYGNLDLSLDSTTKGIGGMTAANPPTTPPGDNGWMPAISSNLSYVGIRGFQSLGSWQTRFVYQLETEISLAATSGTTNTNSNTSDQVKGGLTSRNTFIGLASPEWGAAKIGKTDAPYKTSTQRMNPFSGMIGDYSVIMGNSGGDNRVEFGTRVDHSVWYESPKWNGFSLNALFSPGQNRSLDSSNIAAGESDCAGGNIPGSGALPAACNDGAFNNLWSGSLAYEYKQLYLTGAYEMHKKVNRTSDLPTYNPLDIADERAWKIGLQYVFPTRTTFSVVYENIKRNLDASLQDQNERSRTGYWFALSQDITDADSLHFGWAHANRTPGDPGQHNPDPNVTPDANGFYPGADNHANMYTIAYKHKFDKNLSWYGTYAATVNGRFAHYDLGAGGRSVTTDCHDASNPDQSGFDPNGGAPHCWTGAHLQGVSVGMKYQF